MALAEVGAIIGAGVSSGISVVVGILSAPAMAAVAQRIDAGINRALSRKIEDSNQQFIGPGVLIDDHHFQARDEWFLTTGASANNVSGYKLFEINVQLEFASNLVNPELLSTPSPDSGALIKNYPDYPLLNICQMPMIEYRAPASLNTLAGTPGTTLYQVRTIATQPSADTNTYNSACLDAHGDLTTKYGLTNIDALRAVAEVSFRGSISSKLLEASFLTERRSQLLSMGYSRLVANAS